MMSSVMTLARSPLKAMWSILGLGLISLLVRASLPGTAQANFFGVDDPFPLGVLKGDLADMKQGNVQWVHTGIQWPLVEPIPGQFSWQRSDKIIGDLASKGIHVFPYVLGSPPYAATGPYKPPLVLNGAPKAWQGFLRALVNRYGPGGKYWTNPNLYRRQHPHGPKVPITSWQIWHEPNLKKHFDGTVAQYARLLRISHTAIHGADPHAKVILAGLAAYAKLTAWGVLNELYKEKGIKRDFDAVAVHPYAPSVRDQALALKRTRGVIKRHHDAHTPIWITEL